jgi:hypothetical protein
VTLVIEALIDETDCASEKMSKVIDGEEEEESLEKMNEMETR